MTPLCFSCLSSSVMFLSCSTSMNLLFFYTSPLHELNDEPTPACSSSFVTEWVYFFLRQTTIFNLNVAKRRCWAPSRPGQIDMLVFSVCRPTQTPWSIFNDSTGHTLQHPSAFVCWTGDYLELTDANKRVSKQLLHSAEFFRAPKVWSTCFFILWVQIMNLHQPTFFPLSLHFVNNIFLHLLWILLHKVITQPKSVNLSLKRLWKLCSHDMYPLEKKSNLHNQSLRSWSCKPNRNWEKV